MRGTPTFGHERSIHLLLVLKVRQPRTGRFAVQVSIFKLTPQHEAVSCMVYEQNSVSSASANSQGKVQQGSDFARLCSLAVTTPRTLPGLSAHFVYVIHLRATASCFTAGMNEIATEANKLWGIYHTDREYARTVGDPLRTVVEAPTKLAAEEAAARLGFGEPWAHPVSREQVNRAQWLPQRRPGHRQELAHKKSRGVRV